MALRALRDGHQLNFKSYIAYGEWTSTFPRRSEEVGVYPDKETRSFLCAWRERKKLQPGKVKSWLATVARNRALNRLRDRRELLPLEEDVLVLAQDSPQRELENREVAQLVRAALETLEPSDRELFVRHYYYGQTVEKAAEEMEMNRSTAKTRLRRGREKLKRQLEREGYIFEED